MGDLKPLGSEKLTGQEKIKRIMEIARFNEVIPSNMNETARSEYSISLADGNKYEIVKERQGYIIKKTISESQSEYIEPMKNRKYYTSYSQAFKRLNLVAGELNRLNENEEGVSLFGEQKKFTLKTPKPAPAPAPAAEVPAAPPAVPSPELPPSPTEEMPMDAEGGDMGMDMGGMEPEAEIDVDATVDVEGPNSESEKVTFKTIQKLTGKLTQKIRTLDGEEGMTSEDIKYVINMVLSSLNLGSLSEEDKEDIMSKFDEESEDLGGDDMGGEDLTDDSEVEDIQADMDIPVEGEMGEEEMGESWGTVARIAAPMVASYISSKMGETDEDEEDYGNGAIIDSIFGESKVDKVISKYFEVTKKEILETKEKQMTRRTKSVLDFDRQMKEIVKLTETIEQELAAEKFLKKNATAKVIGKTNKKNLVFENKGGEVRISPEGVIL
jgi:hypothetical protein